MFFLARRNVPSTTSTFKRTHRIVIATLAFGLALGGVALRVRLGSAAGNKPAPMQQPASPTAARQKIDLLNLVSLNSVAGRLFSLSRPLAPSVSATKTDALFTDVDGDLQADPGDTLQYTVNINASGEDATGVTFTDTVDPNTAFVAGSLRATPVAVDDNYSATGNIRITVAAPGVLGNDFAGEPSAAITAPPVTSTNGGNVTLNADGSFTYNPPAGFEGSDTFNYTLTNSEGSNAATVTINVSGMIWFVNNTASCPCDGRLTNPFNTLASFQAVNNGAGNNPAANDNIFLYESATDYIGPVTLLNGQRFIGQDATASLSAITGLTPPSGSDPLPVTDSGNATIVNVTTGNAINVGSGNTLRGFTGGDSTTDISGASFGTLTISDVTLNGTGQALNLTTGTLAATFVSISSLNSATTGITMTGVGGSLTTPTTTITNSTGIGISVDTSSATLNFGTTASTSSGGTGVNLNTNSGTVTFGTLNISPDANQRGLHAIENSNTITSTGGTISTSGAAAVEVTRTIGTTPLAITLTSVSTNGGPNGILLSNTSGSLTVLGSGGSCTVATPTCTGGRIQSTTGADGASAGIGVRLSNATNVSLTRMRIDNHSNFAIRGLTVVGFTLDTSLIDGTNGTSSATDDSAIYFTELTGSASISNSTITNGYEFLVYVVNTLGVLNRLTISNTTINGNNTTNGDDALHLEAFNSAVLNATVQDSIFTSARGDVVNVNGGNMSNIDLVFRGNKVSNNHANILSGGGGAVFSSGGAGSNVTMTYDVSCNSFRDARGIGLNLFKGSGSGNMSGTAFNNRIGVSGVSNSGSSQASGINVDSIGSGSHTALLKNNTIFQHNEAGIIARANSGSSTLNLTVIGNSVSEPGAFAFAGFYAEAGALGTDTNVFNLKLGGAGAEQNNFVDGDPFDFADVWLLQNAGTFNLTRGNSVSGVPDTVVMDNNVSPITTFTSGVTVVIPAPALPAAVNEACSIPARMVLEDKQIDPNSRIVGQANDELAINTLFASGGENTEDRNVAKLTQAQLWPLTQAAMERWREAGLSAEDLMRLQGLSFEITDLPDGQLATVTSTKVQIDESAAGYGWYLDLSPMEDSEFDVSVPNRELQTTEFSPAFGRMDLLTVVLRQLGHISNQGTTSVAEGMRPLMQNTLSPAVRRLPNSLIIQLPGSRIGVTNKNQLGNSKRPVAQVRKAPVLQLTTGASRSEVATRKAGSNPIATTAVGQGSMLMSHAPGNRTAHSSPSIMLADVMLSIGTLPAGESVTITFNVTVDDPFGGALPQVSNQGTVSGSNFADVLTDDPTVAGTADPTVTPIDLPQISLTVSPASVLENGATNLVYTFTRTGSTANAMTVNFSVGGTASFTEPDYTQSGAATFTATSGTVVIPGGSPTATVTIDPSGDSTVEPDETVDLTLSSGTGYVVGAPSAASGTITNDDTDVSIAVSPGSVAEDGATNLVYTFTRNGDTSSALTVNFSVGGTADFGASPDDYTQTGATTFTSTSGSVTFAPSSSTAAITVDPESDTTIEADETVILTLTSGAGYNVGSPSSASGTITNDDANVSVAVSPASVTEDGATNLVYTFTRTGFTTGSLTVNFSVGGTAVFGPSPDDYTQTGATTFTTTSGSVTFAPGSPTAAVTVDPETDTTAESDETVIITLTAGAGYNAVSPTSATGTILNDDTLVSVVVAPSSTAEGGANLVYTFTRTGPTGSALTVNFSVGGSASFPADYSQSGAATFTPPTATVTIGVGSSTATVTVTPLADCMVEGNETVDFTVQPGAGYGVGSPSTATGTITNTPDSGSPTITLIPNVNMTLWPPNHQYENIAVTDFVASASDDCDPTVNLNSVYILSISSDEAENGSGDGNTMNDIVIGATCKTAQLRAERSGNGNGRVYTITFKVMDSVGNFTTATTTVTVRKSPNQPAVDSGPVYTVNSTCP